MLANNHKATGIVEGFNKTVKRQLSCRNAHLNDKFNFQYHIQTIIQKLRITKQKNTKLIPIEGHFG